MNIVSKPCRKPIMWFLMTKDSELSLFGVVCRWSVVAALVSCAFYVFVSALQIMRVFS